MMTVELLETLSLVSFIAACVIFLVGVALFFLLDIPKIYGDVSGRTAKKAIEAIRQQNESTGNKAYKPSAVNAERGKLTDKITPSGRLLSQTEGLPVSVGTERFETAGLHPQSNDTVVTEENVGEESLFENEDFVAGETSVLTDNVFSAGETSVLTDVDSTSGETTVLIQEDTLAKQNETESEQFSVEVEMSFTVSSELIE